MIELTPSDVAVILRLAGMHAIDEFPTAELNDDGQTEIVRWIESVGKLDDQLSPYAWYSLAEEAATAYDPDEPILIEMLSTYALSGEDEILELCRIRHFDWSIDAVPVRYIENAEDLVDTGVPVRFVVLAEAAGEAFTKRVCELCADRELNETELLSRAIHAYFQGLCKHAGIMLDDALLLSVDEEPTDGDTLLAQMDEAWLDAAMKAGEEVGRSQILLLDPDFGASLSASQNLFDRQRFKTPSA